MSKLNINGVDLELDLLDADVVEKFEKLNSQIVEDIKNPNNYAGKSTADSMRFQCRLIDNYFNELFGAGTSEKVFGTNNKLDIRIDAFGQVSTESDQARKFMDSAVEKYNPGRVQNRQQRRQEFKKKRKNNNFSAVDKD